MAIERIGVRKSNGIGGQAGRSGIAKVNPRGSISYLQAMGSTSGHLPRGKTVMDWRGWMCMTVNLKIRNVFELSATINTDSAMTAGESEDADSDKQPTSSQDGRPIDVGQCASCPRARGGCLSRTRCIHAVHAEGKARHRHAHLMPPCLYRSFGKRCLLHDPFGRREAGTGMSRML